MAQVLERDGSYGRAVLLLVAFLLGVAAEGQAGALLTFDAQLDPAGGGANDFLSHVHVIYDVPQPGFPFTALIPTFSGDVPLSGGPIHHELVDPFVSSPIYPHSFAIIGIYNSEDPGVGESFFSTFSQPNLAIGSTFDTVFVDLGYTETDVIQALQGNDPTGLVLSYLSSYILEGASSVGEFDNSGYQTLFTTPVQTGQTATLVHFSEGTAFGTATSQSAAVPRAVPEPASWALLIGGGLTLLGRRRPLAAVLTAKA